MAGPIATQCLVHFPNTREHSQHKWSTWVLIVRHIHLYVISIDIYPLFSYIYMCVYIIVLHVPMYIYILHIYIFIYICTYKYHLIHIYICITCQQCDFDRYHPVPGTAPPLWLWKGCRSAWKMLGRCPHRFPYILLASVPWPNGINVDRPGRLTLW